VLVAVVACGGERAASRAPGEPAPAGKDVGDCADVAQVRVCWPADGSTPRVRLRPLPDAPRPSAGWRCHGRGLVRRCEDRARGAGPFVCEQDQCVQRYPRVPDDGEWECIDLKGVAVCRRGVAPAGVVAGPPDRGWRCSARAGASPPERVCVDYSPDLPDDESSWRCRYEHARGQQRICRRVRKPARLGGVCDAQRSCPRHLSCAAGVCLPHRPDVSCWFDDDCGDGRVCRLGTCVPAPRGGP